MKLTRDEQIVRAAKLRARIVEYVNTAVVPQTRAEIFYALKEDLERLGYKEQALDNYLGTLVKVGVVLKSTRDGKSAYGKSDVALDAVVTPKVVKPKQDKPTIVVDIIKNTGRVRLTLNGLLIEIGIV